VSTNNARIVHLTQVTRPHHWRWWLQLVVQGAVSLCVALAFCLIAITIIAQLVALPHRSYWIVATLLAWVLSVLLMIFWRVRQMPNRWRRLDLAYGWQSALATAVFFATAPNHPLVDAQYQATLTVIAATPARQLRVWSPRRGWALAGALCLLVGAWVLPTPFDRQIAQQQQFQQLAQSVAQQLQQLPPLVPIDATALATSSDPQTLVAQLNATTAQVTAQAQASQQLQRLIPQLQQATPAQQQALLAAAQPSLGAAQTTAVQQALNQAQQGNPAPLQALADQAQAQAQVTNQWQQALSDAKNQTLAQSQSGAPTSQSRPTPAPPATNQNGTSTNQSGTSANQNGTSTNQSGTSANQNGTSANQSGTSANQSGTSANQNGTSANQSGTGTTGQPGGNGSGSGSGGASATQLFVPQLDGTQLLTVPAQGESAPSQTVLRPNTDGGAPAAPSQQYAAVVADAARTANQAIVSNQIPWSGQATVRDYFAALQQEAP
jgi:hypothetical protein